jgi:hypothetical protein
MKQLSRLRVAPMTPSLAAQTPEEKGKWTAEEAEKRDLGWTNSEVNLNMVLRNSDGDSSVRDLWIKSLEVSEPKLGDMSVTIFDKPRDIKGTAFLSHTKIFDPDDQWLYLPALKRVKRISSANKSGPFVRSEFAYEDLVSQEVERYSYKWLRDEACGDLECYVVERTPVYEHSGYTEQIVWLDKTDFQPRKLEFYDRKDSLLKTLMLTGYHTLEMTNHQTGKSTRLTFSDYRFKTGQKAADFRKNRLKRAK